MTFRKINYRTAVSECGRYELHGAYSANGNFWNGFEASTGRLIAASGDKGFVIARCETDSLHVEQAA